MCVFVWHQFRLTCLPALHTNTYTHQVLVGEEALLKRVHSMELENIKLRKKLEEVWNSIIVSFMQRSCVYVRMCVCVLWYRDSLLMKDIRLELYR